MSITFETNQQDVYTLSAAGLGTAGPSKCSNGLQAHSSEYLLESWYIVASRVVHFVASFFWEADGISDAEINSIHADLMNAETALYSMIDRDSKENDYFEGRMEKHFLTNKEMKEHYSDAAKKINALQTKTGNSVEYILALVIPDSTHPQQETRDYKLIEALNDLNNMPPKK